MVGLGLVVLESNLMTLLKDCYLCLHFLRNRRDYFGFVHFGLYFKDLTFSETSLRTPFLTFPLDEFYPGTPAGKSLQFYKLDF